MHRFNRRRATASVAVLAFSILLASPCARAQTIPGVPDMGFRVRYHVVGGGSIWKLGTVKESAGFAGTKAGAALDGFQLSHMHFDLTYQVYTGGDWQAWSKPGGPAGIEGKPIEAIRMKSSAGITRYRVFTKDGPSAWAEEGGDAGTPGSGKAVVMVELGYRYVARPGATFQYRALFQGREFTPWAKAGEPIDSGDEPAPLTALEFKSEAGDILFEYAFLTGSFGPTAREGSPAGDLKGRYAFGQIRVMGPVNPIDCRVRILGKGWTEWAENGRDCGSLHGDLPIVGVHLRPAIGTD